MPNSISAKKSHRQSLKRRARNRGQRSALRTSVKKVRDAVANGETEQAASLLSAAAKKLDQAAAKNLIHANKAARTKSRLAKLINNSGE
ncbi:MAG: 30S ribosomal protein S20 [Planctomycetota bacterium]|jgi:small subunit ribosomal protein S20|nr:30S ribosomal protein S20 [Planctomycetota bacterium]MEE3366767.1 30S ribosomal protein S20 [Planctomycetota bacterium]|tara:strand:+ start:473 stop:739 length:267 start_codon:yes stop_codon:yes gene_type:complete